MECLEGASPASLPPTSPRNRKSATQQKREFICRPQECRSGHATERDTTRCTGPLYDWKMHPQVTQIHGKEKRWKAEFASLRQLCLASGLNEDLKWGQACYDLNGSNVVLIHGFKDYCALLFMKGALLKDPKGLLIQQTKNVQSGRQMRFTSLADVNALKAAIKSFIRDAI